MTKNNSYPYPDCGNNAPNNLTEIVGEMREDYDKKQTQEFDPVNRPSHYAAGRFEVIDIIEDQLGIEGLRGFCLGNALKYVCRAGKKDPSKTIQDLEKAVWYLNHYIARRKNADGR